jgi:hypothetical protein
MTNMLKKSAVAILVGLLLQMAIFVQPIFAREKLMPEKVKSVIEGIGINSRNIVKIKLTDNKKYRGFIRSIEEDKFILLDNKKGAVSVSYADVEEMKEENPGKEDLGTFAKKEGIKTVLVVGATAAVIGIAIAIGSSR